MSTTELRHLRYGHDERAPAGLSNPRKANRDEGIEQLSASILSAGVIQPLAVVDGGDGFFYVAEGNRRLRALERLREAGALSGAYPVPTKLINLALAREAALAANVVRVPLHEADQYEAFTALANEGLSEDEIASRFGIDRKRVQRILALGRLSPKILQAWREGAFPRSALECVQAFTLAPSVKAQEKAFEKLRKNHGLWPHVIRAEFGAGKGDAAKHYAFVGREVYEAAGGKVTEDLFGDDHVISDPALAKRLSDEKLKAECARLVAEGWAWASDVADLPQGARWSWQQVSVGRLTFTEGESARLAELQAIIDKAEDDESDAAFEASAAAEAEREAIHEAATLRRFDAKAKAKSGCILMLDHAGQLEIKYGVLKPDTAKPAKTKSAAAKEKKEPGISNALIHRLSQQLTQAAAEAVKEHPQRAFEIAVAALMANSGYRSKARLKHEGMLSSTSYGSVKVQHDVDFEDAFRDVMAMDADQQLGTLAGIVGQSFDFQTHNSASPPLKDEGAAMICEVLGQEMVKCLRSAFDADDYFASISRALIDTAIKEMGRPEKLKGSKAEVAATAAQYARETGWLPRELRTRLYDGPGSQPAGQEKPKSKAPASKASKGAGRKGRRVEDTLEEQAA